MEILKIRRGDSTDFFYNIHVNITPPEDIDLSKYKAILQIGSYQEVFNDIADGIDIVIDAQNTKKLLVGKYNAYLKFITPDDTVGTTRALFVLNVMEEVVSVK